MSSKSKKALIILTVPFVLGFFLGLLVAGGFKGKSHSEPPLELASEEKIDSVEVIGKDFDDEEETVLDTDDVDGTGVTQSVEIIYYSNRLPYSKLFDDINELHLKVADSIGLGYIPKTSKDINTDKLVHITDNEWYVVDDLRYSAPYLTKGAAKELDTIGKAFADSLKSKNLLSYKLIVSSILRTEEDVRKLQRINSNASDKSSHCYGTTFDITYTRYFRETETPEFMQPYELTKVLGEVLRDQKKAKRCIVKYERKEHCFHITSTI